MVIGERSREKKAIEASIGYERWKLISLLCEEVADQPAFVFVFDTRK